MSNSSKLSDANKIRFGREALTSFQNQMVQRYGNEYQLSLDTLIKTLTTREPDFLIRLGGTVADGDLGLRRLSEAMERVVIKSKPNEIPKIFTFQNAIAQELSDFDWSIFPDAAIDIVNQATSTVSNVSDSVFEGVKGIGGAIGFITRNLKWILLGLLGVMLLFGAKWAKQIFG